MPARGSFMGVRRRPSNDLPIRDSVDAREGAIRCESLTVFCDGRRAEAPAESLSAIESSVSGSLPRAAANTILDWPGGLVAESSEWERSPPSRAGRH